MNYLKLKCFDDKYGRVYTDLPKSRHYRNIQQLTAYGTTENELTALEVISQVNASAYTFAQVDPTTGEPATFIFGYCRFWPTNQTVLCWW